MTVAELIDALRTMQPQSAVVIRWEDDLFGDITQVTHIDTSALGDESGEHAIVFLDAVREKAT